MSIQKRLYRVIGFLGTLPVLCMVLTLCAVRADWEGNAALDRAALGSIYLERLNGLIYAVVMESRGIYMSPDWQSAEPFATQLAKKISVLRQVANQWRDDTAGARREDVEDVGVQVEQFAKFRTELLRRAREESTAAAREMGDNDLSRTIRTALNDRLAILAHTYETESRQARIDVHQNEIRLLALLAALTVTSMVVLVLGCLEVRRRLLQPILQIGAAMESLSRGKWDITVPADNQAQEIADMSRAVNLFRGAMQERDRLEDETNVLSELNDWLQCCNSLDELYQMTADAFARILPKCRGSLYIYSNSRDVLDGAKGWNNSHLALAMHPEDCWGLRRGRPYTFGQKGMRFVCAHVTKDTPDTYCCIPVLAHGETIGLLHLEFVELPDDPEERKAEMEEERRLGLICAEQISLAIANVKLRDQLRDQSTRDALTGLYNRRYMLETCRRLLADASRTGDPVSVLSIDVDHFKKFNDSHGHDAGDTVLQAVAKCFTSSFNPPAFVCRFGGEEFIVILPGDDVTEAARRANDVRARVEGLEVRYLDGHLPKVSISVGVSTYPRSGTTLQELLMSADAALYRAKKAGRNRVELCDPEPPAARPAEEGALVMRRNLAESFYVEAAD